MKRFLIILTIATFFIAGCATAPKRPFVEVNNIPKGKGVVYIYMPSKGNYLKVIDVRVDNIEGIGSIAANLNKGTYMPYIAPVGENLFRTYKTAVNLNVEEGESYFIKVKSYKFFGVKVKLENIDPSAGFVHIKQTQQR